MNKNRELAKIMVGVALVATLTLASCGSSSTESAPTTEAWHQEYGFIGVVFAQNATPDELGAVDCNGGQSVTVRQDGEVVALTEMLPLADITQEMRQVLVSTGDFSSEYPDALAQMMSPPSMCALVFYAKDMAVQDNLYSTDPWIGYVNQGGMEWELLPYSPDRSPSTLGDGGPYIFATSQLIKTQFQQYRVEL